jgi:TctA family transporter
MQKFKKVVGGCLLGGQAFRGSTTFSILLCPLFRVLFGAPQEIYRVKNQKRRFLPINTNDFYIFYKVT